MAGPFSQGRRAQSAPGYRAETLDYVKRGLDDLLEQYRDPVTRKLNLDESGRSINSVRANLLKELDGLNPAYKRAREAYASQASLGTDAQRGYKATSPRVAPETVSGVLRGLPDSNRGFYQQGFASSLADTVERSRLSSDPYNVIYGSPAQQQKLGIVFPDGASAFGRARAFETDMSKTAYETLGGSPTASRFEADKLFDADGMANAVELGASAMSGTPPIRLIAQSLPDIYRMGVGKAATRKAEKIGPALLNTSPADALQLLEDLHAQQASRRAYIAQARRAGGMFGAPLALPFIPSQ
jgi:hypothetical protein